MAHDELLQVAQKAISALVSDTSVPQKQTQGELIELSESLQDDIDALDG